MEGTKHFSVTDGQHWEVYETHKPVPIDEKRIVSFDLKDQPAAEACLQALALWRPAVEAGHVAAGQTPVIDTKETPIAKETATNYSTVSQHGDDDRGKPAGRRSPIAPTSSPDKEQSLATVEPGVRKPIGLTLSDGSSVTVKAWKHVLVEVTKCLVRTGDLTESHCPIPYSDRSRRYVAHTIPDHPDGKPFDIAGREQIGSIFVDTKHTAGQTIRVTRSIIEHVGQDPAQFKVRFP